MGCAGSLPEAEEYLIAQSVPTDGQLLAAPTTLRMTGWPIGIGLGGKERAILTICDLNDTPVATLLMPPQQSFGVGASLMDPAGNVVATLASAEQSRSHGSNRTSYCVYAGKPQFAGQTPDAKGLFLWAKCTRRPFTFSCNVTNGAGADAFKLKYASRSGFSHASHKVKIETAAGEGVMLVRPTVEKPKRHHIECATGGDPILHVCIPYACNLAVDELQSSAQCGV